MVITVITKEMHGNAVRFAWGVATIVLVPPASFMNCMML